MEHDAFAWWKEAQPRWIRHTIWGRSLLEEVPPRFRGIYTLLLPLNHLLLSLFGLLELQQILLHQIVPVVEATSYSYGLVWSCVVSGIALCVLIGLCLRIERLELYAVVIQIVAVLTYPVADLALVITGHPAHQPIIAAVPIFLILPAWRIFDIVRVIRRRDKKYLGDTDA